MANNRWHKYCRCEGLLKMAFLCIKKYTCLKKGSRKEIVDIILQSFTDDDIELFVQWLNKDYIKKWYGNLEDWINEVKNRSGEFNFINHFIVKYDEDKIGFCQYYDCYDAQEEWYKVINKNEVYSIDYLIGEEEFLNKGFGKEIVKQLIDKVKTKGGRQIIVQPEPENKASNRVLTANGFIYDDDRECYFLKT